MIIYGILFGNGYFLNNRGVPVLHQSLASIPCSYHSKALVEVLSKMSAIYTTSYYPESSGLDMKTDYLFDRVIGLLTSCSSVPLSDLHVGRCQRPPHRKQVMSS